MYSSHEAPLQTKSVIMNGKNVKLQIRDVSWSIKNGNDEADSYQIGGHIALFVIDINMNDEDTIKTVKKWVGINLNKSPEAKKILVVTKCEEFSDCQIKNKFLLPLVNCHDMDGPFFVSSKNGNDVNFLFESAARAGIDHILKQAQQRMVYSEYQNSNNKNNNNKDSDSEDDSFSRVMVWNSMKM